MVKEKSSSGRIFDKDGYRKVKVARHPRFQEKDEFYNGQDLILMGVKKLFLFSLSIPKLLASRMYLC